MPNYQAYGHANSDNLLDGHGHMDNDKENHTDQTGSTPNMPAHRQNNGNMKARTVAYNPVPHQDLIQLQHMLDKMNFPLDQKTNKESTDKHPVQCHEMEE